MFVYSICRSFCVLGKLVIVIAVSRCYFDVKNVFVWVNCCFQIFELFFPFLTDWPSFFFVFFDKGVIFRIFSVFFEMGFDWLVFLDLGEFEYWDLVCSSICKMVFFPSLLETWSFVFLGSLRWTFWYQNFLSLNFWYQTCPDKQLQCFCL